MSALIVLVKISLNLYFLYLNNLRAGVEPPFGLSWVPQVDEDSGRRRPAEAVTREVVTGEAGLEESGDMRPHPGPGHTRHTPEPGVV